MKRRHEAKIRRASMVILALAVALSLLAGCTGIRERAQQAQEEIDRVGALAETANQGAIQNAGSIRALSDRIDALEADVARFGAQLEALKAQERDGPGVPDGDRDAGLSG